MSAEEEREHAEVESRPQTPQGGRAEPHREHRQRRVRQREHGGRRGERGDRADPEPKRRRRAVVGLAPAERKGKRENAAVSAHATSQAGSIETAKPTPPTGWRLRTSRLVRFEPGRRIEAALAMNTDP